MLLEISGNRKNRKRISVQGENGAIKLIFLTDDIILFAYPLTVYLRKRPMLW